MFERAGFKHGRRKEIPSDVRQSPLATTTLLGCNLSLFRLLPSFTFGSFASCIARVVDLAFKPGHPPRPGKDFLCLS